MADNKILESEKLDDDQLEDVAGGLVNETHTDKAIMFNKGLLSSPQANDDELRAAFARYNIRAEIHGGYLTQNKYYLPNGQKLNHQEVWQYIAALGQ